MTKKQQILIIDDHQLFAEGLTLILNSLASRVMVTICTEALTALEDIEKLKKYDLVLLDLHMPYFSGFDFLMAIQARNLNLPVAVFSGSDSKIEIERSIRLGAKGFIPKCTNSDELISAVTLLLEGKCFLSQKWDGEIGRFYDRGSESALTSVRVTNRQMQVLKLMSNGLQNKQIALALGISPYSVKDHVKGLFRHFQVNNRTMCVQTARDQNLV